MGSIEDFLEDAAVRGLSPHTIRGYGSHVRLYEAWLQKPIKEATRTDLINYIKHLREGRTTQTLVSHLTALGSYYDYMIFMGITTENPVGPIRKRYVQSYKIASEKHTHKLISSGDLARLINSIVDIRDKAMVLLLFKCGLRVNELCSLKVDSIRWDNNSLVLEKTKKRSNATIFFDEETARYLKRWLRIRKERVLPNQTALFPSNKGGALGPHGVLDIMRTSAARIGLDDPRSRRLEDRLTTHCGRHWFTDSLFKARMPIVYIEWLRGDAPSRSMEDYLHLDQEDVRKEYLNCIPQLGI